MAKPTLADKLVVAISSRALFDLSESHRIFTEQGVEAYQRYQIAHEDELLAPGPAFTLVKKRMTGVMPAGHTPPEGIIVRNAVPS